MKTGESPTSRRAWLVTVAGSGFGRQPTEQPFGRGRRAVEWMEKVGDEEYPAG